MYAVNLRDRYIWLVGKVAHVWTRSSHDVRVAIVDHHQELDQILDLIQSVGEAADIGPLKGLAGICRLLLGKVKVRPQFVLRSRVSRLI
jgi:hypothetical protein